MRIDFIRSGKVITYYPVVIRAQGDLFRAISNAFEQLRKEHPTLAASEVELSLKYENQERARLKQSHRQRTGPIRPCP